MDPLLRHHKIVLQPFQSILGGFPPFRLPLQCILVHL